MKKYIEKYLFLFVSALTLLSCYEDKSKLDTDKLPEVRIEIQGYENGVIRIGYNELLKIEPLVYKSDVENHPDLEAVWEVSEYGDVNAFDTISNTVNLEYVVERGIVPKPYVLKLTVWDKVMDFRYYKYYQLIVSSSYGEGIVVSYTDDDISSDIALIMDKQISGSYNSVTPSIRKGLYSVQNDQKIDGLITGSCYTRQGNMNPVPTYWFTLNNGNFLSLNCVAYEKNNTDMIFVPENFKANLFVNTHQSFLLFADDGVYVMSKTNDKKPTIPVMTAIKGGLASNNMVSYDSHGSADEPFAVWYNEEGYFCCGNSFPMKLIKYTTPYEDPVDPEKKPIFDWSNLPNKECKAASISHDGSNHTFLLKDKSTGEYEVYGIGRAYYDEDYNYYQESPKSLIKIPASANDVLNNAVSIFFMYDQTILYVATATEIYTINFVTSPAIFNATPQYSAPSGETIVTAKLYQQGQFTENREQIISGVVPEQPLNNKAIYFATMKNGNQGTVWVVPMVKNLVSSGTLEKDATKFLKYEGFSRILDISAQGI